MHIYWQFQIEELICQYQPARKLTKLKCIVRIFSFPKIKPPTKTTEKGLKVIAEKVKV
jgi:hypothetical protein